MFLFKLVTPIHVWDYKVININININAIFTVKMQSVSYSIYNRRSILIIILMFTLHNVYVCLL